MSTVERIQAILDCEVRVPDKDNAGIITPEGVDSKVRIDTLKECLKIAQSEERKLK
jgi:hypothetical protein